LGFARSGDAGQALKPNLATADQKTVEFEGRFSSRREALAAIMQALDNPSPVRRLKAMVALEQILHGQDYELGAPERLELLQIVRRAYWRPAALPENRDELLKHKEKRAAYGAKMSACCRALGLDLDVGVPLLRDALKSQNSSVREAAQTIKESNLHHARVSVVLLALHPTQAVGAIKALLASPAPSLRVAAAQAASELREGLESPSWNGGTATSRRATPKQATDIERRLWREFGGEFVNLLLDVLVAAYKREQEFVCRFAVVQVICQMARQTDRMSVRDFLRSVASSGDEQEQLRRLVRDALDSMRTADVK